MSERLKEAVLKTVVDLSTVGSNPTLTANKGRWLSWLERLAHNRMVLGSIPRRPTNNTNLFWDVAKR